MWLWVTIIESETNKNILAISISKERNMFAVAIEHFLTDIVDEYGEHPVSTDGGTWYPQACQFLKLYDDQILQQYQTENGLQQTYFVLSICQLHGFLYFVV